jgi:hypothetical protein
MKYIIYHDVLAVRRKIEKKKVFDEDITCNFINSGPTIYICFSRFFTENKAKFFWIK